MNQLETVTQPFDLLAPSPTTRPPPSSGSRSATAFFQGRKRGAADPRSARRGSGAGGGLVGHATTFPRHVCLGVFAHGHECNDDLFHKVSFSLVLLRASARASESGTLAFQHVYMPRLAQRLPETRIQEKPELLRVMRLCAHNTKHIG